MYRYRATIRSVYDGDTFRADLDLGFGIVDRGANGKGRAFRLHGIDTPELRGDEREKGIEVRDYVRELMKPGDEVIIDSIKDKSGKYGRYLAVVLIQRNNIVLNSHLVAKGMAIEKNY